ncbi:NADP-dependent oxidoreductase domain-containing protein [Multifurca ochricompacta]|uniref:NADP-dependent oxidoreductase domain-containing protein n=1 Tax=Multifurca ochricompacta TaxID=376703 RepID=A0AAD4QRT7_9AGAM|nr:NADP-dependent oxidoreductase domain-containing protein [Multifurca ochricompacta]
MNHPRGHQPEAIRSVLETSLKALHPHKIRDTLREINKLHGEGKFQFFGLSNFAAWELVEIIHICKANNWIRPTYYQTRYNAISRALEQELIPASRKYGLRIVTYNALAAGFFAGKISKEDAGSKHMLQKWYLNDSHFEAMKIVRAASEKANIPLGEIGYRWLQHHSTLSPDDGIICGVSTVAQLKLNIASSEKGPLPEEIVGHDEPLCWR